jgi:hypothetical protein
LVRGLGLMWEGVAKEEGGVEECMGSNDVGFGDDGGGGVR